MTSRALMPDYLRLIALFGIVVVNVQFMAFPVEDGFAGAAQQSFSDYIVAWLVNGLALLKTYGLFSFMFGVGLAFQIRSAERRGLPFGRLYRNRMIGLALFGIAHGILFFPGDILLTYAITGTVLYFWRDWSAGKLVRVGSALLVVQIVLAIAIVAIIPASPPEMAAMERQIMTGGSMMEVSAFRGIVFAVILPFVLLFQGLAALGWFCLGLAAVKSGLIDDAGHPLWARARRLCLVPGIALSLLAAGIWQWYDAMIGEMLVVAFAPLATLGYLGLIAALAHPPGPMMERVLKAGASSLSIYLGQSIILATIFAPYGLGLWDQVSPLMAVLMALATTVGLILFLIIWRNWFAQGPFEWALRKITRIGVKA